MLGLRLDELGFVTAKLESLVRLVKTVEVWSECTHWDIKTVVIL